MIDLTAARTAANQYQEHSGHYQDLQVWVFDLCDEIERLRGTNKNSGPQHPQELT